RLAVAIFHVHTGEIRVGTELRQPVFVNSVESEIPRFLQLRVIQLEDAVSVLRLLGDIRLDRTLEIGDRELLRFLRVLWMFGMLLSKCRGEREKRCGKNDQWQQNTSIHSRLLLSIDGDLFFNSSRRTASRNSSRLLVRKTNEPRVLIA